MRSKKEIEQMIVNVCSARQKFYESTPRFLWFLFKFRLIRFQLAENLLYYFIGCYNPDWFNFDKCIFVDKED